MESLQTRCTVSGAMSFVLFISFVAGIAPLKFVKVHNGWRIETSRVADIYGKILIISFCIFASVNTIERALITLKIYFSKADVLALMISITPAIIGALFTSFTARKRMKYIIHYLAQLEKINGQLNQINSYGNVDFKENNVFVCVAVFLILGIFSNLSEYFVITYVEKKMGYYGVLSFFKFILYEYIQLISVQFFVILSSVLLTYKHFNVCLKSMLKRIDEEKFLVRQRKETPATIHRLAFLYCSLCDIMRSINENYGALLAHHVLVVMMNLISNYYFLFGLIFDETFDKIMNQRLVYISISLILCSMLFNTSNLIVITEPCHRIQTEIKVTKITLSKLLRTTSPSQHEINSELLLFYRHVTRFDVNISPLKMFTLNRNLITKILASVITYSVILINSKFKH